MIPKFGGRDCEFSTTGLDAKGRGIDPGVVTSAVLAQITTCAPRSFALDTAIVMPRSLKDAVGLSASYFRYNSNFPPMASTKFGARMSGVLPSSNVTTGVASVTGRNSA